MGPDFLWPISNEKFIAISGILFTIHAFLSYFSIRKLLSVRGEIDHPMKGFKVYFWYLVVFLNLSEMVCQLFGWSEEYTACVSGRGYLHQFF